MATGTITSTGLGSGLDIESLVTGLVAAERAPTQAKIDRGEQRTTSLISALGQLTNAVASVQSTITTLADSATFNGFATTTTQPGAVWITADDSASPASYDVAVTSLATQQSLASGVFASADTVVGSGTLTIDIGTPTYSGSQYSAFTVSSTLDIPIGTDSTLSQIRDAINEQDAGVEASLVKDGGGYRLLLVSEQTGLEKSIQLTVTSDADGNDADAAGLSQLAFNSSVANLTQSNAATDAQFSINGLDLTSSSNQIDDVVDGVSLTLLAETTTPAKLKISEDRDKITKAIEEFVEKYNTYVATNNGLTAFNPATEYSGPLAGDFSARSIASSLRTSLTSAISGASSFYDSLATVGITTTADGELKFDSDQLNAALDADKNAVVTLFAGSADGSVEGVAQRAETTLEAIIGSGGLLESRTDSLNDRRDSYVDQRIALDRRMATVEARYRAQFNALDILMAELTSTGDFLKSQLEALPWSPNSSQS